MGGAGSAGAPAGRAGVQGPARRRALCLWIGSREQCGRGLCEPAAQEAGCRTDPHLARPRVPAGSRMMAPASLTRRLIITLTLAAAVLWLLAAFLAGDTM